jgi:hypothetical protein
MTEGKNAVEFRIWDTPPNDLVRTVFEEVRIVPIEMLHSG